MKAFLRESKNREVLIDLEGEDVAERALLSHLQDKHVSILCAGPYGEGSPWEDRGKGLRLFIRNEADFEVQERVKPKIERQVKRKLRRRRS